MKDIQSVIFNKTKFTPKTARLYLKEYNLYPLKRAHVTTNFIRYRMHDPRQYKDFITKDLKNGVEYIIGIK
jgi:hypothetical protein